MSENLAAPASKPDPSTLALQDLAALRTPQGFELGDVIAQTVLAAGYTKPGPERVCVCGRCHVDHEGDRLQIEWQKGEIARLESEADDLRDALFARPAPEREALVLAQARAGAGQDDTASILAEHQLGDISYVGGGHGTMGSGKIWCSCREVIQFDWYEMDGLVAHRAHLAAVLTEREALVLAEARAEAWDEGWATAEWRYKPLKDDRQPNPYRTAATNEGP